MSETITTDQLDLMRRERLALAKLTDKQKKFCEEYVRSFDKVQSLQAGGYYLPQDKRGRGTSQKILIERNFEKVMSSAPVQEYIFLLKQSVASRLNVSMDSIIDEYKSMAFTNMDDYVEWDADGITSFKSSEDLTRAQKAGILEITETTTKLGKTIKIKLHNKQTALDRLFEVLKELEENETKPEGPAKISQTQINILLQDPVKRRAIEHFAEGLFDKQICLVGTDKDRLEFDKHMAKITEKLRGITVGNKNSGSVVRIPELTAPQKDAGESGDGADHSGADTPEQKQAGRSEILPSGKEEGDAGDAQDGELEDGRRYDIDGL
jgi:hypothetical protein